MTISTRADGSRARPHARGRRTPFCHGRGGLLAATVTALLATTAACGSAATGAGLAAPPASHIPPRSGVFSAVPPVCSLVDTATLRTLVLAGKAEQAQPPVRQGGVSEQACTWGSPAGARSGPRSLTVTVDLFTATTGQAPAAAAAGQFQQAISDQAQADNDRGHPVPGLASAGFISHAVRAGLSQSHLHVRDQNVIVTIAYAGSTLTGGPMNPADADNGALTAAHAILSALTAS